MCWKQGTLRTIYCATHKGVPMNTLMIIHTAICTVISMLMRKTTMAMAIQTLPSRNIITTIVQATARWCCSAC